MDTRRGPYEGTPLQDWPGYHRVPSDASTADTRTENKSPRSFGSPAASSAKLRKKRARKTHKIHERRWGVWSFLIALTISLLPIGTIVWLYLYLYLNGGDVRGAYVYSFAKLNVISPTVTVISIIFPHLIPFAMGLLAVPLSAAWLRSSANANNASPPGSPQNPTPFQFGILIELCYSAGWGALLTGMRYLWKADRNDDLPKVPRILRTCFAVLATLQGISLALSGVILFLQHGSSSVLLPTYSPATYQSAYGRELNSTLCGADSETATATGFAHSCLVSVGSGVFFYNRSESVQTSLNSSTSNYAFPVDNSAAVILQPDISPNVSFVTDTIAVSTTCSVITPLCTRNSSRSPACCFEFDCGPTYPNISISDISGTRVYPNITQQANLNSVSNPSVFFAILSPTTIDPTYIGYDNSSTGYFLHEHAGTYIIMRCELTLFNVQVTQISATVTDPPSIGITMFYNSSDFLTNNIVGSLYLNSDSPMPGELQYDMDKFSYGTMPSEDYANIFARQTSIHTVGFAAPILRPAVTINETVMTLVEGVRVPSLALLAFAILVAIWSSIIAVIALLLLIIVASSSALAINIARLRLTEPLYLVHQTFFPSGSGDAIDDDVGHLFNEHSGETRLAIEVSKGVFLRSANIRGDRSDRYPGMQLSYDEGSDASPLFINNPQ